ncbi:MAG: phosphoribosylanthranilate isomerase [Aggregatilineales bacterium]
MTIIKICGITRYDDAVTATDAGADMLGLNFFKRSPRYIEIAAAREICDTLREAYGKNCPVLVGLFVNATDSDIAAIMGEVGLDFAQLSGDESDEMIAELRGKAFKSIRPMNKAMALDDTKYYQPHFPSDDRVPSLILDAYHPKLYGGTGETASIEVAQAVKADVPRMMLAGGLNPENIAERMQTIQPWGVDVASGVEDDTPGIKSAAKIQAFVQAVRGI